LSNSSLTYYSFYSLLNVVPVVAVAFAIAKGFGLEKLIEPENQSDEGERISKYLKEISEAIKKLPANVRLRKI